MSYPIHPESYSKDAWRRFAEYAKSGARWGLVGGSIHKPQVRVDPRRRGINLTFGPHIRFVPAASIAQFAALPPRMLIDSYKFEARLMAHIITQCEDYAHKRFSTEVIRSYYESRRTQV